MKLSKTAQRQAREMAERIEKFALYFIGVALRPYQVEAAHAILKSVFARDGKSFVIIFARQSGKDELIAILFLFLLLRFIEKGADIVCAQPTFKPQTVNAMERLKKRGLNFGRRLSRTAGYIMRLGLARVSYFSADKSANQVGATADRLLVMNEAQDIPADIYDVRFSPMAASGNATKVFSGTSWTADTLLSREKRAALEAEKKDGVKRVFIVDAEAVGKTNKLYALHVEGEIKKLGRQHPFIRTQYFCEELDAQASMFPPARRILMVGSHPKQEYPETGKTYCFLIDVAGSDENVIQGLEGLSNTGRDSTALTIVEIDLTNLEIQQAPTYRVVNRMKWTGQNAVNQFGVINSLFETWNAQYIVIDATGVGEGLYNMLYNARGGRVIPLKFTPQSKSEVGYGWLAIIETGRWKEYAPFDKEFDIQLDKCRSEILIGPAKTMRWGVKEGTRHEGELVHDDYVTSAALAAELDKLQWIISFPTSIIHGTDPLDEMSRIR